LERRNRPSGSGREGKDSEVGFIFMNIHIQRISMRSSIPFHSLSRSDIALHALPAEAGDCESFSFGVAAANERLVCLHSQSSSASCQIV
jgi:hypothetical protein